MTDLYQLVLSKAFIHWQAVQVTFMVYNTTLLVTRLFTKFLCVVKPLKKSFGLSSCLHLLKLGLLIEK